MLHALLAAYARATPPRWRQVRARGGWRVGVSTCLNWAVWAAFGAVSCFLVDWGLAVGGCLVRLLPGGWSGQHQVWCLSLKWPEVCLLRSWADFAQTVTLPPWGIDTQCNVFASLGTGLCSLLLVRVPLIMPFRP
jgi:hypothetical protein